MPAVSDELREHILNAERAAQDTPTPSLRGQLTDDLDPSLKFARTFRERLPSSAEATDSRLTRGVLLAHGRHLSPESSWPELRDFLWLVNAWGYGTSGYGVPRTLKVLADRGRFENAARGALTILHEAEREHGAVESYFFLYNDAGHVPGWGPAFFTKFLTFADPMNQPDAVIERRPALILDQWIATAVNHYLPEPFRSRRPTRRRPLGRFGRASWNTPQYAYYLRLVEQLALNQEFAASRHSQRPMALERVLFQYFREGEGRREKSCLE